MTCIANELMKQLVGKTALEAHLAIRNPKAAATYTPHSPVFSCWDRFFDPSRHNVRYNRFTKATHSHITSKCLFLSCAIK